MRRLNFLENEPWDEVHDELRTRVRRVTRDSSPETSCTSQKAPNGLHTFSNPTEEPARLLTISLATHSQGTPENRRMPGRTRVGSLASAADRSR